MRSLPKLALLDRDGVLNVDVGYACRPDQIQWIPGALAALARLRNQGIQVAVVTNQSGVARGMYTESDVEALHAWMGEQASGSGGRIDAFYSCPFHPEAEIVVYRRQHPDRKPAPGMIYRALKDFDVQPDEAFLIGDRDSDIAAARAAGVEGHLFAGGSLDDFVAKIIGTP